MPAAELAARLAEAYRLIGELTARVEQLERQARKDSSTSSRPPSSDSPYKKKDRDRSLRERGKRRPGKQPGDPGTTMCLVDDPDERLECPPPTCHGCGASLGGQPVTAQRRHQVTDITPAPAPKVTEYVAQAKGVPVLRDGHRGGIARAPGRSPTSCSPPATAASARSGSATGCWPPPKLPGSAAPADYEVPGVRYGRARDGPRGDHGLRNNKITGWPLAGESP